MSSDLAIGHKLTKCSNESCQLSSDQHIYFTYFLNNALVTKILQKSADTLGATGRDGFMVLYCGIIYFRFFFFGGGGGGGGGGVGTRL